MTANWYWIITHVWFDYNNLLPCMLSPMDIFKYIQISLFSRDYWKVCIHFLLGIIQVKVTLICISQNIIIIIYWRAESIIVLCRIVGHVLFHPKVLWILFFFFCWFMPSFQEKHGQNIKSLKEEQRRKCKNRWFGGEKNTKPCPLIKLKKIQTLLSKIRNHSKICKKMVMLLGLQF